MSDPKNTSISRADAERLVRELLRKNPGLKDYGIIFRTPTTQYKIQEPANIRPAVWLVLEQSVEAVGFKARLARAMPDIVAALFGTASCVALGVASVGEVAVAPVSGGATMALAALTYAGAAASAASTGVAYVRVYNEVFGDPENNRLMDSTVWCKNTMLALDAIAIGSLTAARAPLLFSLLKNKKTPGMMLQQLEGMNRATRKELTKEIGRVMVGGQVKAVASKAAIAQLLKREVLEVASAVCGVLGSLYSGALGEGYKFVIRAAVASTG